MVFIQGEVENVYISNSGSELTQDTPTGATQLLVTDAYAFEPLGGSLTLNGEQLVYTSCDVDNNIITLAAATAVDAFQDDEVLVYPPGTSKWAMVDCDDLDEGILALIPRELATMFDDGIRDDTEREQVTVSDDTGRWILSMADEEDPLILGSSVSGVGLPPLVPTDAPSFSPAIKQVTGTTASLVVESEVVDAGTSIEYHVYLTSGYVPTPGDPTTLVSDTQSLVAIINHLADGTALVVDTPYYVRTYAHNVLGYAPAPSGEALGQLNLDNVDSLIAASLIAGFILAGSITVGQMTIDADTGITINAPGGGTILHFPVNGVDPLSMTAQIIAQALTVQDNLVISGSGVVYGDLVLANGIQDPTTQPTLSSGYPKVQSFVFTDGSDRSLYVGDMVEYPGDTSQMLVCAPYSALPGGGSGTTFWLMDKATGAYVGNPDGGTLGWQPNFYAWGGIAYSEWSGYFYVLGTDFDNNGDWYIYEIDPTDWTRHAMKKIGASTFFGSHYPKISAGETVSDAEDNMTTDLMVWWTRGAGDLMWASVELFDMDTSDGLSSTVLMADIGTATLGGAFQGYADLDPLGLKDSNNMKFYIAIRDGGATIQKKVLVFNTNQSTGYPASHASTYDFNRANNGKIMALAYDRVEGQFVSMHTSGNLYRYGGYANDKSIKGEFAWYDADATGGTHETAVGPVTTYTLPARAYLNVATPPAPDAMNTDPSNHDKANQVKLYLSDDAGTTWKSETITDSPWSDLLRTPIDLTTDTPGSGTPFPVALTPGSWRSAASDTGVDGIVEKIHIKGSGDFRIGNYSSVRHFGIRSKASNQSIPASTPTVVTFGTAKEAATGLTWDNTNNQWIVAKPGVYSVQASIEWDNTSVAAGSHREVGVFKNGSNYAWTDWSSAGFIGTLNTVTQPIALMVPCVAGDTIQCRVFTSGAAPVIGGDDSRTWFSCAFVSQ